MHRRIRPCLPRLVAAVALCLTSAVIVVGAAGPAGAAGAAADVTVTIDQGAGQPDPTFAAPILFDVVFSEPVVGFDASDVVLSGTGSAGATATVTTDSFGHTVSVSGMTSSGTVIASIPAGAARSSATGELSSASTSTDDSVSYILPPSVTISPATQPDTTTVAFNVVFSEPVTGFGDANSDVVVSGNANPTAVAITTVSPTSYTVKVSDMTTSGTVIANIPADAATSIATTAPNTAAAAPATVSYVKPFTVTINVSGLIIDPTSVSPISFDVVFSGPVTGFDNAVNDVVLSGTAGATTAAITATDATSYTVDVSGMTQSGTVIATIPAGAARSIAADQPNQASTSLDNNVDFVLPTPSSSASSTPTPIPTCSTPACSTSTSTSTSTSASALATVTSTISTTVTASALPTSAAVNGGGAALASTGATSAIGLLLGLLLIIGGTALTLVGRRRATRRH